MPFLFNIKNIALILSLALLLPSCAKTPAPPLTIVSAKTALGLDAKLLPTETTNVFFDGAKKVFCWFEWKDAVLPVTITARWTFLTANIHILDYNFAIPRKEGFGGIALVMPEGKKLPLGKYQVDLVSGDKVLKTIQFTVDLAPANSFELTGNATMVAGSINNVVLTAYDRFGNIATGYNGPHILTFSGANNSSSGSIPQINGISLGNPVTVNFNAGVSEPNSLKLTAFKAEHTTVYVSDGSRSSSGHGLALSVTAADANHLEWVTGPSNAVAGEPLNPPVTILLKDAYGNVLTDNNSTQVSVALGNNPGKGTLSGTLTRTAKAGLVTFDDLKLDKTSNGYTLNASLEKMVPVSSASFNISAATAQYLALTGEATMVAGSTNELIITAYDAFDNLATSYTGEYSLTFSGSSAAPNGSLPLVEEMDLSKEISIKFINGVSVAGAATLTAFKAESTTIHVADASIHSKGHGLKLNVSPAASHNIIFLQGPSDAAPNKIIVPSIKIQLRDAFNNTVTADNSTKVLVALGNNPRNATILGTVTQRAIGGLVIFDNLSITKPGISYVLIAGPDSLTPIISELFNISKK